MSSCCGGCGGQDKEEVKSQDQSSEDKKDQTENKDKK